MKFTVSCVTSWVINSVTKKRDIIHTYPFLWVASVVYLLCDYWNRGHLDKVLQENNSTLQKRVVVDQSAARKNNKLLEAQNLP